MTDCVASDSIIEVLDLCKIYRVYPSPREFVRETLFGTTTGKDFHALSSVNFRVRRGEVVGLIGPNGAGKSTLLKILAGTLDHSSGSVTISGAVSAILELGTGFQPEYSGRDNIVMGAMCTGMSRTDALNKVDEVIEFSELRDVIDQPFRTYSSGMKARLTFSTAISVEPDVFIVDEALAAGDAYFVNKCLRRMKEICSSGATVFFVSHSTDLVRRLCTRAIYIENGSIRMDGEVLDVCATYDLRVLNQTSIKLASAEGSFQLKNLASEKVKIQNVQMSNDTDDRVNAFFQHESVTIKIEIEVKSWLKNPAIWLKVMRSDGVDATSWLSHEPISQDIGTLSQGKHIIVLGIPDLLLGDGEYLLTVGLFPEKHGTETAFYIDPLALWEQCQKFTIRRRGRPLSTIYDQQVEIIGIIKGSDR